MATNGEAWRFGPFWQSAPMIDLGGGGDPNNNPPQHRLPNLRGPGSGGTGGTSTPGQPPTFSLPGTEGGLSQTLGGGVGTGGTVPGADAWNKNFMGGANHANSRQAPQMDTAPQAGVRQDQESLIQALIAQSQGLGPSVAQGQLQQATDRTAQQAQRAAATAIAQGVNPALAQRQTMMAQAGVNQQAASDSALLAQNEQMAARNQLAQVLAGTRGQDIALAGEQAGISMQQRGLNDAMVQFYLGQGLDLAKAQQQAAMQMTLLQTQTDADKFNKVAGGMADLAALGAGG